MSRDVKLSRPGEQRASFARAYQTGDAGRLVELADGSVILDFGAQADPSRASGPGAGALLMALRAYPIGEAEPVIFVAQESYLDSLAADFELFEARLLGLADHAVYSGRLIAVFTARSSPWGRFMDSLVAAGFEVYLADSHGPCLEVRELRGELSVCPLGRSYRGGAPVLSEAMAGLVGEGTAGSQARKEFLAALRSSDLGVKSSAEDAGLTRISAGNGQTLIVAFADPGAHEGRFSGQLSCARRGDELLAAVTSDPSCRGLLIHSASGDDAVVISRDAILADQRGALRERLEASSPGRATEAFVAPSLWHVGANLVGLAALVTLSHHAWGAAAAMSVAGLSTTFMFARALRTGSS